ncbi:SYT4 [Symbiodinium natans]|uniref:SYT4 protein n=1 Tax=Symbiodinium natans TaxID=878477 RepID=A0A812V5N3_9DINO|nr:SYT4 [Symbiodinium natans]
MVTHSWRNKFTFLLAALIADALNNEKYDHIAQLLSTRQFGKLVHALSRASKLDAAYWICAFSVNQHTGICATPPPTDSTGQAISPCSCSVPKHFDGDLSEMNKFDDMMAFLKRVLRQRGQAKLEQVVALEKDFSLLSRVWCIAELVEAHELHLQQAVKMHSSASRDHCLDRLLSLDVTQAEASFPADKDLVLGKITDVDAFNSDLQKLLLHRLESFLHSNSAKSCATLVDEVVLATVNVVI